MNTALEAAYQIDPALWMQDVLGITPHAWQEKFLRAKRGASIAVLTARQVGKTTAAAVGMAHSAVFMPGSLSVIACPTQDQSAEALRKVREMVLKAGAKLTADNVFKLELANGSRVRALSDKHESIRGLTVDAWIVADEAAQLDPASMAANANPAAERALRNAVDGVEPHGSILVDVGKRILDAYPCNYRRGAQLDFSRGLGKSARPTQRR